VTGWECVHQIYRSGEDCHGKPIRVRAITELVSIKKIAIRHPVPHAPERLSAKGAVSKTGAEFVVKPNIAKERELRPDTRSVHTPTMTLKNAALLALVGTILMTILLLWNFVFTFLNVLRDLVPAVTLFSTFIYAFGSFSVMVFFFVFHRTQS
jgi:hypothetical protein